MNDPRAVYLKYKGFNANETPFKRLQRYYSARAEDQSRIFYTFPRSRMSILVIVHKRVPIKEFQALLLKFFKEKATRDVTRNEDVEIRVVKREETERGLLDDWSLAGGDEEEEGDGEPIRLDGRDRREEWVST